MAIRHNDDEIPRAEWLSCSISKVPSSLWEDGQLRSGAPRNAMAWHDAQHTGRQHHLHQHPGGGHVILWQLPTRHLSSEC